MTEAYVAVLVAELRFPQAGSLKSKRKELSSIKAQLRSRLHVAVAEVGHQDTWQRSTIVVTLTSGSLGTLTAAADEVERFIRGRLPDDATVERLVTSLEDLRE